MHETTKEKIFYLMYYKQKNNTQEDKYMSEKFELLAQKEMELITKFDKSSSHGRVFDESNKAIITGQIVSELKYDHKVGDIDFYRTTVKVKRISQKYDYVPIIISNIFMDDANFPKDFVGKFVQIAGKMRSYDTKDEEGKMHLDLYILAKTIVFCDEPSQYSDINLLVMTGYICKPIFLKKTPLGKRIADLQLAINRGYGKSDYLPCIAWNNAAEIIAMLEVGDKIKMCGRIQSRDYFKRNSPNSEEGEWRIAYEVSIFKFEILTE